MYCACNSRSSLAQRYILHLSVSLAILWSLDIIVQKQERQEKTTAKQERKLEKHFEFGGKREIQGNVACRKRTRLFFSFSLSA